MAVGADSRTEYFRGSLLVLYGQIGGSAKRKRLLELIQIRVVYLWRRLPVLYRFSDVPAALSDQLK